jgi:hypothetical protein
MQGDENQERKNDMAQTVCSQSALVPVRNERDEECVRCRRDGTFRGKERQTEKRATRKSRKQRGKQPARMMRKPERYLKDCILSEPGDELDRLAEEAEDAKDAKDENRRFREMKRLEHAAEQAAEDTAEYVEKKQREPSPGPHRRQDEEWYNQNILSNPRRTTLLRQLQYAAEWRHTLTLCSELCSQGRASATDTLMAGLVSLAPSPTLPGIQRQIISMAHTEPPPISTPFVPGIYLWESFDHCREPWAQVLVIFPGMKTARWARLLPGCGCYFHYASSHTTLNKRYYTCERLLQRFENQSFPDVTLLEDEEGREGRLLEDYALLVDYALDPSLDRYEARINGNEIEVDHRDLNGLVGTAVHRSELSPDELAYYEGLFNHEDLSDWLINFEGRCFHLRVQL